MLLVTCSECEKANTLDSQFCRSCGQALPEEALADARQANNDLVESGIKLLGEGRHDEAFLAAEEALQADPSHVNAMSLKGDALERLGKLADALVCYERVTELLPNSPLDRIKVEHVRRMLTQVPEPARPNRRAAVGAALAATALVATIGISAALMANPNKGPAQPTPVQTSKLEQPTNQPNPRSNAIPLAKEVSREEYERLRQEALANQNRGTNDSPQASGRPEPQLPPASGNGRTSEIEGSISPMRPSLTLTPITQGPATNSGGSLPRPSSQDPDPPTNTTAPSNPGTTSSPGTVDIRPTPGNTTQVGGSEVISDETTPTWRDHTNRARQYFNSGDYAKAAQAYEAALSAGANPASTNQRLGQCYQRLGRKADAKRAYSNAIRYYEAMVQNEPNSATLRTALESCQQALKSLG